MEQFYPIIVALVFNLLDLCTGIITAVKLKDIQSSKLRDGLFKKVGFLYVCTTALVSILENICKINPDILPEKLMKLFHIYDDKKGD